MKSMPATAEGQSKQASPLSGLTANPPALVITSLLLVPAGCFGFIRLFETPYSIVPIIGAAVVSGGLAVLLRAAKISLVGSLIISLLALAILIEIRYAPGTQQFGILPTRQTLEALRLLVDDGLSEFQAQRAPVDADDSLIAASIIAVWLMAFLTDWGALRLRLAFEPVLPASLLFVFASILGSGLYQRRTTLVFAASVVLWTVAQRSTNLANRGVWLVSDARRGPRRIASTGLALGLVALVGGLFVGQAIPGSESEELYYWRDRGEPTRFVTSPYVSIQSQLAEQTDTIMFTVIADQPAYWRVAGLDTFDEGIWKMKGTFESESGRLPGADSSGSQFAINTQEFHIEALSNIWLPAAFSPSRLVSSDVTATWNSDTGSLTVSDEYQDNAGANYVVESKIGQFSAEELTAAPTAVPSDIAARYLSLPDDITPIVQSEASRITASATSRYEQMLALQEYFRAFEYSLSLNPREGDPIEQFLAERVGFCQQFSGTFALMARSIGAPTRVAVGFTWGDRTGNPNEYEVSGRHAHAWPEVWFEGLGWVAFEPTPGRGAPNAAHTQHEQAQDAEVEQETTTSTLAPELVPSTQQPLNIPDFDEGFTASGAAAETDKTIAIPWRLVALIGTPLAYIFGLPLWHRWRRTRRIRRATTPTQQIELAWSQALESLELGFFVRRDASETRNEFADRAASIHGVPREAIYQLAGAATTARYAHNADLEDKVIGAKEATRTIVEVVRERVPLSRRWVRDLDPRRIWK